MSLVFRVLHVHCKTFGFWASLSEREQKCEGCNCWMPQLRKNASYMTWAVFPYKLSGSSNVEKMMFLIFCLISLVILLRNIKFVKWMITGRTKWKLLKFHFYGYFLRVEIPRCMNAFVSFLHPKKLLVLGLLIWNSTSTGLSDYRERTGEIHGWSFLRFY